MDGGCEHMLVIGIWKIGLMNDAVRIF